MLPTVEGAHNPGICPDQESNRDLLDHHRSKLIHGATPVGTTNIYCSWFWKPKVRDQGASPVRFLVRVSSGLCPHMAFLSACHRERATSLQSLFYKDTNPITSISPPNSIQWGVRVSTGKFWRDASMQPTIGKITTTLTVLPGE